MKAIKKKICGSCHHSFECSAAEGCWCFKIQLTAQKLEEIKLTYNDCLCPDCLKKISLK